MCLLRLLDELVPYCILWTCCLVQLLGLLTLIPLFPRLENLIYLLLRPQFLLLDLLIRLISDLVLLLESLPFLSNLL